MMDVEVETRLEIQISKLRLWATSRVVFRNEQRQIQLPDWASDS